MNITICSDVHLEIKKFHDIVEENDYTIQLGDLMLGIGNDISSLPRSNNYKFIRGNHDDPKVCKKHPNYLGDYGYIKEWKLFYMSGACSPDYRKRIRDNLPWFPDEQLSYQQFSKIIKLWMQHKPKIVLSHEAPRSVAEKIGYGNNSLTQQMFELLRTFHKPDLWVFAHYHRKFSKEIDGTKFKCMPLLGTYTLEV